MANKKITELPAATALTGSELFEVVQGGINKQTTAALVNHYRGDWAGTNAFPATGGTYTGGAPAAGDRWRLTAVMTIGGTDVYDIGTIIEAATNTPGQTTANWIKYAVQL